MDMWCNSKLNEEANLQTLSGARPESAAYEEKLTSSEDQWWKTASSQSFGINVRSVKSSHEITTTGQQEACDECSRIAHTAVMN